MMWHHWIRRIAACLLLLSLGLTVPAVAGPMHICLTEWLQSELVEDDCCNHGSTCCDPDQPLESPCCLDISELPDASAPPSPESLPEVPVVILDWSPSLLPLHAQPPVAGIAERPERIRGPCSHSTHRALLEIWRL